MSINFPPYLNVSRKHMCSLLVIIAICSLPVTAQIKYVPSDERSDAGMGVDRVARFFTATYESKVAQKDEEILWVQLDLGEKKKIDGIKLLPKVNPWGYVQSIGFPARFKIEVSDDPDFKTSVMYENRTREIFQDPYDAVCTFNGKEVNARYIRLTALQLRQQRLAMSKIMVMSDGKDIAEGCPASDSESGNLGVNVLTRPPPVSYTHLR